MASGCGCGGLAPDKAALIQELHDKGEQMITVKYVGAPRANLRGQLTRRSYGKVDKNDVIDILVVDYKYKERLYQAV